MLLAQFSLVLNRKGGQLDQRLRVNTAMTDGERKLVVIVAIDVVGHSASIEQNEANTVAKLKQYRSKLDPMISNHGGRIFNTGGDSVTLNLLALFSTEMCHCVSKPCV